MTQRKANLWLSPKQYLPLGAVTETIAILGIRGSGKTNTAGVFAEELLDCGQQVVVIDPTDVWWGLKSSADGKAKGFPVVVLGGRRADLPLAAGDGATLADFVCDTGTSIVLSLRHFESKHEQQRFITDFARRLYWRKGQVENPSPLMLIIDEASLVVPQRVQADEAQMVGAIQKLVRQGRSSGIGVTLIDQRAATINKDVLTQLELLICHRTTSPQDRKALEAWVAQHDTLDQGDEFLESLARLAQGTAWFWSPGWLDVFTEVDVRLRKTFDSSRTPKPGETVTGPTAVAPVDLDALRGKLAATLEKARQDDPAVLRKRIAELERGAKSATADPAEVDRAVATAVARARAKTQQLIDGMLRSVGGQQKRLDEIRILLGEVDRDLADIHEVFSTPIPQNALPPVGSASPRHEKGTGYTRQRMATGAQSAETRAGSVATSHRSAESNGDLSGLHLRILTALAELDAIGFRSPTREQVGFYVGTAAGGGYFRRVVGELKTSGFVAYPDGGALALTDAGRTQVGEFDAPRSRAGLHERVRAHLSGLHRKMFEALIDVDELSRDELARAINTEAEGGYFRRVVGEMKTAGLITYPRNGYVAPAAALFPEGLS